MHLATLKDGTEVAVKVLRPGVERAIARDVLLLETAAGLLERLWADGRRLKPREVVAEFARHLDDELDLVREAANASLLRRNFADSPLLAVPAVHWDYCSRRVMVMERMHGTPISQVDVLQAQGHRHPAARARRRGDLLHAGVPRRLLPRRHASGQHPRVADERASTSRSTSASWARSPRSTRATSRRTSSPSSTATTGAWRRRTWTRAGCRAGTRVDDFEAAIRAVCEPIFARPLKEIYFGKLLLRLFQTSRRFNVEVQPQLVMLQKTLLNIEGLGRELDPDLDLWQTAKPYLERWMSEQVGWRGLLRTLRREAPCWAQTLPALPRLLHRLLAEDRAGAVCRRRWSACAEEQPRSATGCSRSCSRGGAAILARAAAGVVVPC